MHAMMDLLIQNTATFVSILLKAFYYLLCCAKLVQLCLTLCNPMNCQALCNIYNKPNYIVYSPQA